MILSKDIPVLEDVIIQLSLFYSSKIVFSWADIFVPLTKRWIRIN